MSCISVYIVRYLRAAGSLALGTLTLPVPPTPVMRFTSSVIAIALFAFVGTASALPPACPINCPDGMSEEVHSPCRP